MSEEKFDVIIVGGGLAGLTAGYVLAKAGAEVAIIERGPFCGSKNMTGGRLYTRSMAAVMPNFAETAPLERKITTERFSRLTQDSIETVEYHNSAFQGPNAESYSVLRAPFDQWFAAAVEDEGAMTVCGICVDDLIVRDGKVCGVIADGEEMEADVVLLADGVNSLLAQKIGLRDDLTPAHTAVGIKDVIELPAGTLESRLGLAPGEGLAWMMFAADYPACAGDVFLYSNRDSISLGVITGAEHLQQIEGNASQLLETLKEHPALAPIVADGKLLEYSAHLIPQGGYSRTPALYGDGVLVAGDAAGLALDLHYMIRGMDFAIESGRLAAETILEAKELGNFTAEQLGRYKDALEGSYLTAALKQFDAQPSTGDLSCLEKTVYQKMDAIKQSLEGEEQ